MFLHIFPQPHYNDIKIGTKYVMSRLYDVYDYAGQINLHCLRFKKCRNSLKDKYDRIWLGHVKEPKLRLFNPGI